MRDDDLADGVGVYEADEEDEGDEVVVQDDGLEEQVDGDDEPGDEVRDEAEEGGLVGIGVGFGRFAEGDDVEGTVRGVSRPDVGIGDRRAEDLWSVFATRTTPP